MKWLLFLILPLAHYLNWRRRFVKLTKKLALQITEELWTWLAEEDGRYKEDWPRWAEYGEMSSNCALCEYTEQWLDWGCPHCPYYRKFGDCAEIDTPYSNWCNTHKKVHAQAFLKQIKSLR